MGGAFLGAHDHVWEVWIKSKNVSSLRMEEVVRNGFWIGKQQWPTFKLRDRTDNLYW